MGALFLSYARLDVDKAFDQFVIDLHTELRVQGVVAGDGAKISFRDSDDIALGEPWQARLAEALATCEMMIAMVSPNYLQRIACRMEWAAFTARLPLDERGERVPLLLPLKWVRVKGALPAPVAALQHAQSGLGQTYQELDLRTVVQRGGNEYANALTAIATRIRDVRAQYPLAPAAALPPLDALADPFPPAVTSIAAPAGSGSAASAGGPRHVEFVVVAGRQAELATARQVVKGYGTAPVDWCPYLPDPPDRVGLLLQAVALDMKLTSNLTTATNLLDYLENARKQNTLVVFIVDVWSLALLPYQAVTREFDARRFYNAGALVIWNPADGETPAREAALDQALWQAFPSLMRMKDPPVFHEHLSNPKELIEKLRITIGELRNRVQNSGPVIRKAEGEAAEMSKPHLPVPGSAPRPEGT